MKTNLLFVMSCGFGILACIGEVGTPSVGPDEPSSTHVLSLEGTACEIESLTVDATAEGLPLGPGECVSLSRSPAGDGFSFVVECDDGLRKYRYAGRGGAAVTAAPRGQGTPIDFSVTSAAEPASNCGGQYRGEYTLAALD